MRTIQHKSHARATMEAFTAVILADLLAGSLQAQQSKIDGLEPAQSSIQGVVTAVCPQGQSTPIEGTPVKLIGGSQGVPPLSTFTDTEGLYQLTQLGAGAYSLEVNVEGVKPFAKTVVLEERETLVEKVGLELATVTSKIHVQSQVPAVSLQGEDPAATLSTHKIMAPPRVGERSL